MSEARKTMPLVPCVFGGLARWAKNLPFLVPRGPWGPFVVYEQIVSKIKNNIKIKTPIKYQ